MAWRDGTELSAATLAEDLTSGPGTHFRRLITSLGIGTHVA